MNNLSSNSRDGHDILFPNSDNDKNDNDDKNYLKHRTEYYQLYILLSSVELYLLDKNSSLFWIVYIFIEESCKVPVYRDEIKFLDQIQTQY